MGWWHNHWHHVAGAGGAAWILKQLVDRWRDRRRDKYIKRRLNDELVKLKWEQQRERLRKHKWRDDIGRIE
jgi:hypothetical protein